MSSGFEYGQHFCDWCGDPFWGWFISGEEYFCCTECEIEYFESFEKEPDREFWDMS